MMMRLIRKNLLFRLEFLALDWLNIKKIDLTNLITTIKVLNVLLAMQRITLSDLYALSCLKRVGTRNTLITMEKYFLEDW